jgi:hypothetical protein
MLGSDRSWSRSPVPRPIPLSPAGFSLTTHLCRKVDGTVEWAEGSGFAVESFGDGKSESADMP